MRIQNIANKIEALGGTCQIDAHPRDDNRHIVRLTGKLGRYDIEAIDYGAPSPLSTDADVSAIAFKHQHDESDPMTDYSAWMFLRTIGSLGMLAPKRAKEGVM
ncbi:hypothetical protein [Streptomyces dysideae]|uniref:Uncharacterized protein n=1 Tax=Streptomyces dysideae TaxID=909626 RepID=A0A124IEI6_9ACTN|nr:hypothetical protein [Streptomyces dysideae]KUO18407.1 hypothetical protein AQJ91_25570 [Streptomyces dysideae]